MLQGLGTRPAGAGGEVPAGPGRMGLKSGMLSDGFGVVVGRWPYVFHA